MVLTTSDELRQLIRDELQALKIADDSSKKTEEVFLSYREACSIFQPKISETTLRSWISKGLIEPSIIGGRRFIKKSELLKAISKTKMAKT